MLPNAIVPFFVVTLTQTTSHLNDSLMLPVWAATYGGRRSHEQPRSESKSTLSPSDIDSRRRSSSEATPRPTPAPHPQHLALVDPNFTFLSTSSTTSTASDLFSSSRRLGFFTDASKLPNSTLGNPNYLTLRLNSLDILLSLRVSLWSGLSRSDLYCPGLFNIMVLGYYL